MHAARRSVRYTIIEAINLCHLIRHGIDLGYEMSHSEPSRTSHGYHIRHDSLVYSYPIDIIVLHVFLSERLVYIDLPAKHVSHLDIDVHRPDEIVKEELNLTQVLPSLLWFLGRQLCSLDKELMIGISRFVIADGSR